MLWISFALFATVLVASTTLLFVHGFSPMGTIAAMWNGGNNFLGATPGAFSLCALKAIDLRVKCISSSGSDESSPPTTTQFLALSGGRHFTCGLEYGSHFLICWGEIKVPQEFREVSYSMVASGGYHVCALRSDNSNVDCWGEVKSLPGIAFSSITSGRQFSCGLSEDGSVICWGLWKQSFCPFNETKFVSIFAGESSICGLTLTGTFSCWSLHPYTEIPPPSGVQFVSVAGGLYHSCGIRADNRQVMCWGDNQVSQLMAPSDVRFSHITAGDFYTCGLRIDRPMQLICWGNAVFYPSVLFNVSQGPCVSECGRNQYQFADQLCPAARDKVCLECSSCAGAVESSACGPYTDRSCALTREDRHQYSTGDPHQYSTMQHFLFHKLFLSVAVVAAVLCAGIFLLLSLRFRKHDRKENKLNNRRPSAGRVIAMSPQELEAATNNYSDEMILGRGAFGTVYKGWLPNGQTIAIKRATTSNQRSIELFEKELELLSRIHHSCLVNLVGYCLEEKLLVFEFMSRGSLRDNLFNRGSDLNWIRRINIAAQAARGLEYLHRYACPSIIHRDVKPDNILLDAEWNAHVSDFGISLIGPSGSATHLSNMTVIGTPGYVDPEYAFLMELTTKSDVYSFGVVLLELLSGQRAIDLSRPARNIVLWANELKEGDGLFPVLDSALAAPEDPAPLLRALDLGLECCDAKGRMRPSMTDAAACLENILEQLKEQSATGSCSDQISLV